MTYDPDAARIARLADQRVADMNLPVAERAAARKAEIDAIKMEEAQKAAVAQAGKDRAEAQTERARIAGIVKAGSDMGRPRQALRLALMGPVEVGQARTILGNLPTDPDAPEAALTVPPAGAFGSKAAQAERQRIATIFAHPSAAGHFRAACALALEGEEATPPDAVAALLESLPPEAAPRSAAEILTERAKGLEEFGASHEAPAPVSRAASGWAKAVAAANRHIGATSAPAGGGRADG